MATVKTSSKFKTREPWSKDPVKITTQTGDIVSYKEPSYKFVEDVESTLVPTTEVLEVKPDQSLINDVQFSSLKSKISDQIANKVLFENVELTPARTPGGQFITGWGHEKKKLESVPRYSGLIENIITNRHMSHIREGGQLQAKYYDRIKELLNEEFGERYIYDWKDIKKFSYEQFKEDGNLSGGIELLDRVNKEFNINMREKYGDQASTQFLRRIFETMNEKYDTQKAPQDFKTNFDVKEIEAAAGRLDASGKSWNIADMRDNMVAEGNYSSLDYVPSQKAIIQRKLKKMVDYTPSSKKSKKDLDKNLTFKSINKIIADFAREDLKETIIDPVTKKPAYESKAPAMQPLAWKFRVDPKLETHGDLISYLNSPEGSLFLKELPNHPLYSKFIEGKLNVPNLKKMFAETQMKFKEAYPTFAGNLKTLAFHGAHPYKSAQIKAMQKKPETKFHIGEKLPLTEEAVENVRQIAENEFLNVRQLPAELNYMQERLIDPQLLGGRGIDAFARLLEKFEMQGFAPVIKDGKIIKFERIGSTAEKVDYGKVKEAMEQAARDKSLFKYFNLNKGGLVPPKSGPQPHFNVQSSLADVDEVLNGIY